MITSVFSKSKPINFIIVFFIIGLASAVGFLKFNNEGPTTQTVIKTVALFFLVYFSMLVLHFIVSKNNLTSKSNLEILLYSLFLLVMPQTTSNLDVVLSNVFLLFGLRRIISLRSQKSIIKKLFDAAFWVTVAALFCTWAILFFVLLPMAVFLYTENTMRNWIVPLTGSITVLLIAYSASFLMGYDLMTGVLGGFQLSFDFINYDTTPFLIATTLLLSFGLWASIFYIKSIKEKQKMLRPGFYIVMLMVVISFLIIVIEPRKSGSSFLFMFGPLAIIITNYVETIKEKWFKEIFLATLIVSPFVLLFL